MGTQDKVSMEMAERTTKGSASQDAGERSRWNKTKDAEHEKVKERKNEQDVEMGQQGTRSRKSEGPASDQPQAKMLKTDKDARKD